MPPFFVLTMCVLLSAVADLRLAATDQSNAAKRQERHGRRFGDTRTRKGVIVVVAQLTEVENVDQGIAIGVAGRPATCGVVAIAQDAKVLLLDEPTAGVDAHMARSLTDLLHRLNETMPIVLVSHDVTFVSTHLKRVACLNRRLTCHAAAEISAQVISEMYQGDVRLIRHGDSCPLADPGCHHECVEPIEQSTADALTEPRSKP